MGFTRERVGADGTVRYQVIYVDQSGRQPSAGTFATEELADRAWRRAEDKIADGRRVIDARRGRQRFARYVVEQWLPHHQIEARTRETYTYYLERHILPTFGTKRMAEVVPSDVREWISGLKRPGHSATVIRQCQTILSAVFTTAFNDQITNLHPCRGVKTPPIPRRVRTIITPEQFDDVYNSLPSDAARLLAEVDIEAGPRWGELTELRAADFDRSRKTIIIRRAVVELVPRFHPTGGRFLVKDYPKDQEERRLRVADHVVSALAGHSDDQQLAADDLLFTPRMLLPVAEPPEASDTENCGMTAPNAAGRRYRHGTASAYGAGRCRCTHCRAAVARYRADRRANGKDQPRPPRRTIDLDGHIPRSWFRTTIWLPALQSAGLTIRVRPHDLRHAHASWLLAGGADLQTVKERLGHGSIITTEKYLHTLAETDDTALQALASIRRRSAPG